MGKMKRVKLWLCIILLMCCLMGCQGKEKTYDTTTLVVNVDGTFREIVVEPFDKEYYDASELEDFVRNEIQNYNLEKISTLISLESVEVEDGTAKVTISYKTSKDYKAFNEEDTVFIGTVKEAMEEGFSFDQTFLAYGKKDSVSVAEVTENGSYGIVVLQEKKDVVLPDKILYISENVTTKGKKQAFTAAEESYIIYKK